MMAEFDRCA